MKNVIFLGAGASKADGAPLQNELFREYFCMRKAKKHNMNIDLYEGINEKYALIDEKIENIIKDFFENFFGMNSSLENSIYPTFEEVLGMLDLAISRKEYFFQICKTYNLDSIKVENYQSIRLSLLLAMSEIIDYKLDKSDGHIHSKLISNLHDINNISFISTNYDILIDNAIVRNGLNIDYGFNLSVNKVQRDVISLCKIHGSLNWLYCPVCKNIVTTNNEKGVLRLSSNLIDAKCPKCGSLMEAIIIPPSFFKDYQNLYLSNVWHNTESQLVDVDKVIFCGYSFPDADIYIKYLIKKAEILNQNNITYYIVNNHNGKSIEDIKIEKMRYERFINNRNKVIYTDLSFEDFSSNPYKLI